MRSLRTRVTWAMVLVALVSALITGALVQPLVAGASEDELRRPVQRQATTLSRLPRAASLVPRADRLVGDDRIVGAVSPTGTPVQAGTLLAPDEVRRLLAGERLSLTRDGFLVEAVPARGGGAVLVAVADTSGALASAVRRRVLLAGVLGLVVAAGAALLVSGRLTRSLAGTARLARRLAGGERGVAPATDDRPVAEVEAVTAALAHLDSALATSEARQRAFLLSVSHELRTPLTAVRGYAEALRDGVVGPDELGEVGAVLLAQTERLETYVDDLLTLARVDGEGFHVEPTSVDLGELVTAAAAAWAAVAEASDVALTAEVPGHLEVSTDPRRVRQILDVLLDNAFRVTPAGGRVLLVLGPGPVLEVRDSGPGILLDLRERAFEPGALHAAGSAVPSGKAGLGLAIAHRLTARLGGTLTLDDAPEGGARFTLTLPG